MTNKDDNYDRYFSELYEKHFNRVVKYLLNVVHDFSVAEDLTHDLFFKFYEKRIMPGGDPRKIRNFILKSAKNSALDYIRSERRREERFSRHAAEMTMIDAAALSEIEEAYICGEIISTVDDVLLDFPERTRRIFLDMVEGKKLIDVSDGMSMTRYMAKKDYEEVCLKMRNKLKIFRE